MKKKELNGKNENFHYKMWSGRLSYEVIAEIKHLQESGETINVIFEKLLGIRK